MSKHEAMSIEDTLKLALEALGYVLTPHGGTRAHVWDSDEARFVVQAYKALEAALEAHKALSCASSVAKQDRKYWCNQTEALCNKCKDVCEAEQEQRSDSEHTGEPVAWKLLEELPPPIDQALDDASVSSRRRVLVTNNINATNRMGQPSHVWFVSPQRVKKGEWVGFTDSMQKVEALTHWLDPFDTTPQPVTESHKRKPLTDKAIDFIWSNSNPTNFEARSFARAIEAAHGIKENT